MHLVSVLKLYAKAFLPVVVLYAVISWLSNQPKLPGPEDSLLSFMWFKTAHVMVYGTLGCLLFRAWSMTQPQATPRSLWTLSLGSLVVLAALDEWHQSLVPGRTPTFRDIGIDFLGASVALWLWQRNNLKGGSHDRWFRSGS